MFEPVLVAVLAAGASRRLGRSKQLVPIAGEPMLRRVVRVALSSQLGPVTVVLGCDGDACFSAIADLPLEVLRNEQWQEGLASSIRVAVIAARKIDAAALLLLHGDQYQMTSQDLRRLHLSWKASKGRKACRAWHEDYQGPPVVLPAACFEEALELKGDEGARRLLSNRGPDGIGNVAMPAAVHDLDTPDQLPMALRNEGGCESEPEAMGPARSARVAWRG